MTAPLSSHGSVALTRATGLGSLPALLEARAGERALIRVFEDERVPLGVLEQLQTPIPVTAMIGLFSRAARLTGDRLLGLDVGTTMTHRSYGRWVDYSLAAPTFATGIHRACATIWAQQSACRMELLGTGARRLWRYVPAPLPGLDQIAHSDHILPSLLAFARAFLGPGWRPDWAEVNYPRDADAGRLEEALGIPVRFGAEGIGIAMRASVLDAPRRQDPVRPGAPITVREVMADVLMSEAAEPARSLSAVVALRLLDGASDLDGAARLAGFSVQGLQRRLRQSGHTYREIVDRARRQRAAHLLHETELSVVEIALSLGYEDHANFTRAFNRWWGCPPSEFRRSHASTQAPGPTGAPGHS